MGIVFLTHSTVEIRKEDERGPMGVRNSRRERPGHPNPQEAPQKNQNNRRGLRIGGWALGRVPSLHQEKTLLLPISCSKALGSSEFRETIKWERKLKAREI